MPKENNALSTTELQSILDTVYKLDHIRLEVDSLLPLQQLLTIVYDGMKYLTGYLQMMEGPRLEGYGYDC
jgi:hypothetical protein